MDWLRKISRRYLIAALPLLAAIPIVLGFGREGRQHSYTPLGAVPETFLSLRLEPGNERVQLDLLEPGEQQPLSILGYPFPTQPLRPMLSSRSGLPARLMDWRLFSDELASHEIELRCGQDEMVNVELAAKAIDGVIVQPFEIFSFNETVGRRSEERGFRPGLMFWNGEVVTGLGGGVCIVSTALYNAVLKAGYRIIERGHHSGPVRYADPGFDAAVAYSCLDMRFKNNTTSPVMIRCWIEDRRLIVSLRGRKRPGFEVRIVTEGYKELPFKVVETEDPTVPEGEVKVEVPARVGFEVTIVRVLKQDGKVVKREILNHDRIPPRDKIVLIPPKPQEENPGEADSPKDALASGSKPPVSAEEAAQTGTPKPASTAAVTKPEDKESPQASATRAEPPQPDEPIEVNLDVKP